MENNYKPYQVLRPALFAEKQLIQNIVNGIWQPGDSLPPERTLAQQMGITRQTLRETLKTLAAEGWITIQHGKPSVVNDYINQGSLGILKTLIKHSDLIPEQIIYDWLEFRTVLLPDFAQKAVDNNPGKILDLLKQKPQPQHSRLAFAQFDWQLQELLVVLSQNTIVKMIFNDIKDAYLKLSQKYFEIPDNRSASYEYYISLEQGLENNSKHIKNIVKKAMQQSLKNYIKLAAKNRIPH